MHNPPRVAVTPTTSGPDPDAVAEAEAHLAQACDMGTLEDLEAAQDALVFERAQVRSGYTATIGDATFPIDTFAVEHVDGKAVMTLQFEVGSLQLGDLPTGEPAPVVRDAVPPQGEGPRVWGQPGPDPREKVPGWAPADEARRQLLGNVSEGAEPTKVVGELRTHGDSAVDSLREFIRIRFRGDGGAALAVTR